MIYYHRRICCELSGVLVDAVAMVESVAFSFGSQNMRFPNPFWYIVDLIFTH